MNGYMDIYDHSKKAHTIELKNSENINEIYLFLNYEPIDKFIDEALLVCYNDGLDKFYDPLQNYYSMIGRSDTRYDIAIITVYNAITGTDIRDDDQFINRINNDYHLLELIRNKITSHNEGGDLNV